SKDYGVEPVDAYLVRKAPTEQGGPYKSGDQIDLNGKSFDVVGEKDGVVSIREAGKPDAPVKKIFADDLPPKAEAPAAHKETVEPGARDKDKVREGQAAESKDLPKKSMT